LLMVATGQGIVSNALLSEGKGLVSQISNLKSQGCCCPKR
jgi:hypothetical protein